MGRPKLKIIVAKNFALSKGGKCFSEEYISNKKKLKWGCSQGHMWYAHFNSIKDNHRWCPYCAKDKPLTLDEMKTLAKSKGGECMATIYINKYTKLLWRCKNGHEWMATAGDIKHHGTWCPECAKIENVREELCRKIFEKRFNKPFINGTHSWLVGEHKRNLELDGYNEELKLAFEHQGEQHYKVDGYYNKTKEELIKRKKKDNLKRLKCKQRGITLIEIPYTIKQRDLESYIENKLLKFKTKRFK